MSEKVNFELDTIVCGDCLDVMRDMPDGCVDLVIADPPYGIGYASSRTTRMNGKPRIADASFGEDVFNGEWLISAFRILKDGAALYLCTRWDVIGLWKQALVDAGLTVKQRIVWDKRHWGMGDLAYFGSQVEDILFAVKGKHQLLWGKRQGNLWSIWKGKVWNDGYVGHPTQKPVELMRQAIVLSCPIDGLVFDPFLGSGTTAVAALKLGRHFYGCDINPDYVRLANERIEKTRLEMSQMELDL